jgi:hypothetical protein
MHAFLLTSLFQIFCRDREQITEVEEDLTGHTHESGLLSILCRFENDVGLQIVYDLIIAKDRELWQEHKICDLELIIHGNCTFLDEVELAELLSIRDYSGIRLVYPSKHVYDKFINETTLAVLKEVPELCLEILENCTYDLCLHFWWDLLVEIEFFNNQIEIVQEGIMNELFNVTIQIRRDIVGLVGPFYFLDPNVEHAELFID